jgi:hypothetical protein
MDMRDLRESDSVPLADCLARRQFAESTYGHVSPHE